MPVLSILEHDTVPIVHNRAANQKALSSKHASALERMEASLPENILSWGRNSVKFAHYCGVITLGSLTLEILPKIYGIEADPCSSRKYLIKMLACARNLKLHRGGLASISLQHHTILDVFICHFCELLNRELKQGMIRHYISNDENLNVIRGKLLIGQQLKLNAVHREKLYCQYDELSQDNLHNQVIKYVLNLLSKLTTGLLARKLISELLMRFDSISDVMITPDLLDTLNFDRLSNRYKFIFEQCGWFLKGMHPDVLSGNNSCMSLLFDMNRLFEAFAASVFRKEAWKAGLKMREQGPAKYMLKRKDSGKKLFLMRPDMVFLDKGSRPVAIADAKWKILDEREKKLGISQNDLYQMAAYSNSYNVEKVILVYPRQKNLIRTIEFQLNDTKTIICIKPLSVTEPDASGSLCVNVSETPISC